MGEFLGSFYASWAWYCSGIQVQHHGIDRKKLEDKTSKIAGKNLHWNYHLVMTNSLPWKDPPIFKNGKPSISMGHFPWLCYNQRVSEIVDSSGFMKNHMCSATFSALNQPQAPHGAKTLR